MIRLLEYRRPLACIKYRQRPACLLLLFLFLSSTCFAQDALLPTGTKLLGFWGGIAPTTPAWGGLRQFQVVGRKFGIAALEFRYVISSGHLVAYHYYIDAVPLMLGIEPRTSG